MNNYTLQLRHKTNYSPLVEGVKQPSVGCVGGFNRASFNLTYKSGRHPAFWVAKSVAARMDPTRVHG